MTASTTGGRANHSGRPTTLTTLIAALAALGDLDPLDRAARSLELMEAAKGVLATERGAAYLDELARSGETQDELADRIGIHRSNVASAIRKARAAEGQSATRG
jgi:hypothetical protein